jgi:hypothetical protein
MDIMKRRVTIAFLMAAVMSVLAAGCANLPGGESTATLTLTATPDLCAPEYLKDEIEKVNRLMREFDDSSALASNTPRSELRPAISELQRIRRAAEDQNVPGCLSDLKKYQVAHMNQVINTLIGLMGNLDQNSVLDGISRARQLHDVYTLEIARLLGITLVPVTRSSQTTETPAPVGATQPPGTYVSNPGPTTVNLRAQPALDALNLGLLEVNQNAPVLGRSADNQWLLLEMPGLPGSTAWVFASLVSLTGSIDSVPIVTPTP